MTKLTFKTKDYNEYSEIKHLTPTFQQIKGQNTPRLVFVDTTT